MVELHYVDYIVFLLLLLVSALVGPFYMWRDRKNKTTVESYFVGNRALHFIPTAASLFASFWSAIALIGIPAELYTGGAKFFMSSVGQVIGILIGAYLAVPMMYRLKLISSYQYIELRFGSRLVRQVGTVAGILTSLFSLAVTTYAPCVALEAVSPIPIWASAVAVATITMVYTVLGGIRAVVLVDFIQAIVMFAGVLVAAVIGFMKIDGGFSKAMEIAAEGGRLDFFDFNADLRNTYSFYAMVIPQIIFSAGIYATSQAAVQRYSALPTVKQATWSVLTMIPQILVFKVLLFFMALAMFVHYDVRGCDPLRGKLISNPNQLTTLYVVEILNYPGLIGLWFAALFSGSLSTMSTGYNSVAAIIWEDFLKEKYEKRLSSRRISVVLKLITLLLGVSSCLLALVFKSLSGSIIKLTMSTVSVFGAAVFIAYLAGALFPFVNARGTIIGMVSATIVTAFLSGGQLFFKLGNEQVWLPTKTSNCSSYMTTLMPTSAAAPVTTALMPFSEDHHDREILLDIVEVPQNELMSSSQQDFGYGDEANSSSSGQGALMSFYAIVANFSTERIVEVGAGNVTSSLEMSSILGGNSELVVPQNTSSPTVAGFYYWWRDPSYLSPVLLYLFSMSYFLFPFLALLVGVFVAVVVSLLTGGTRSARYVQQRYLMVRNCFRSSPSTSSMDGEVDTSHPCCSLNDVNIGQADKMLSDCTVAAMLMPRQLKDNSLDAVMKPLLASGATVNVNNMSEATKRANLSNQQVLLTTFPILSRRQADYLANPPQSTGDNKC